MSSDTLRTALAPLCPQCRGAGWYIQDGSYLGHDGQTHPEQLQVQCDHSEAIGALGPTGKALADVLEAAEAIRDGPHHRDRVLVLAAAIDRLREVTDE